MANLIIVASLFYSPRTALFFLEVWSSYNIVLWHRCKEGVRTNTINFVYLLSTDHYQYEITKI